MNKDEFRELISEALDARAPVDKDTHIKHHEFIDVLLEEHKIKKQRKEKIKTQVIGWSIIAVLSAIGTAVYHWFEHMINTGGQ